MTRQLYTCPTCGETLSSPPRLYTCPAREQREAPTLPYDVLIGNSAPRPQRQKLSDEDVVRLRTGDLKDTPAKVAAQLLGVHPNYVYILRRGLVRKDVQ